jgi:hypothetical protein
MALLGFMGFDHIPSGTVFDPSQFLNFLNSTNVGWQKIAGQIQGFGIQSTSSGRFIRYNDGNNYASFYVGGRFLTGSGGGAAAFYAYEDAGTQQIYLTHGTDGKIRCYRGTGTTNLLATSINAFSFPSWIWVEFEATIHNTTGAVRLVIGGFEEFNVTGINTRASANNFMNQWVLQSGSVGSMSILDDLYWGDTTGSAPGNHLIGAPLIVETTYPISAVSTTWTPNASTNVSRIQEVGADDDTTYNSTSTSGNIDLYNHGALASSPVNIYGVAVVSRARKDDVAARSFRNKFKSGATTVNGASMSMDTTFKYTKDYYMVDPATSAAWANATAVNATNIGYEHV